MFFLNLSLWQPFIHKTFGQTKCELCGASEMVLYTRRRKTPNKAYEHTKRRVDLKLCRAS